MIVCISILIKGGAFVSKKDKSVETYDKEEIRNKRNKNAEYKDKKRNTKRDGKNFNRQRARQIENEKSREEDYFY